jgi:hypothetical protein
MLMHVALDWKYRYFSHGALASAYRAVDEHVYDRVRDFLRRPARAERAGRLLRISRGRLARREQAQCQGAGFFLIGVEPEMFFPNRWRNQVSGD